MNVKRLKALSVFYLTFLSMSLMAQKDLGYISKGHTKQLPVKEKSPPPPMYKELKIGDKMEDIKFKMTNYPNREVSFSAFKGKYVILDFWATWCGSCIEKFSRLDSLQAKYRDKLQILLVSTTYNTFDTEAKVLAFFKKWKKPDGTTYRFASAVDDSLASVLFPHTEVPHYVWIDPEGIIKAITDNVTVENFKQLLNTNSIDLPTKEDFFANKLLALEPGGNSEIVIDKNLPYYSIFKKGRLDGVKRLHKLRLIQDAGSEEVNVRGRALRNVTLLDLYEVAMSFYKEFSRLYSNGKRLVLDVKDASPLVFDPEKISKDEWEKQNLYTYDLVVPAHEADSIFSYMMDDLNRYSGYYGRIEKRKVKCFTFVRTDKTDRIATKGGKMEFMLYDEMKVKYVKNAPIKGLLARLNSWQSISLPVIDETGYTGNIDLELSVDINDINDIRKGLQKYGLDLKETERELEVFVISDK